VEVSYCLVLAIAMTMTLFTTQGETRSRLALGPVFSGEEVAALPAQSSHIVTAAQVNGTWEYRGDSFKIWTLGKGKLRIEFSGIYEYKSPAGPMANTGGGVGIGSIEGDTAVFRPDGAEDECQISLRFTGGKLIVAQQGICGFGNHVIADGTYHRNSTRKPKFGD